MNMRTLQQTFGLVLIGLTGLPSLRAAPPPGAVVGRPVDVAAFGEPLGEGGVGVQWPNPRDVHRVLVHGVPADLGPRLRLEWWGARWPNNGTGGWMTLDDPYNGEWVRAPAEPAKSPETDAWVFQFPPLTRQEYKEALEDKDYPGGKPPTFRRTLKVRIVGDAGQPLPATARLEVHSDSIWAMGRYDISLTAHADGRSCGRVEVQNGYLLDISALRPAGLEASAETGWSAVLKAGQGVGVRLGVLYADRCDAASHDRTRVTVRLGCEPGSTGFSFVPQDVTATEAVHVPALGAVVARTGTGLTDANHPGPSAGSWDRPVRARVAALPEMTRAAAMAGIPRLSDLRWAPLGVPSARQEIFISGNGDWSCWDRSLYSRFSAVFEAGRDSRRIPFRSQNPEYPQDILYCMLDTRQPPLFDDKPRPGYTRHLEEEQLPLIHVDWMTGPIRYRHSLGTTILLGEYGDDTTRRGDEAIVLLTRLTATNTSDRPATATIHLRWSHNARLVLHPDGLVGIEPPADFQPPAEGLTPLRCLISMDRPVGGGAPGWQLLPADDPACSQILQWKDELAPGQTRTVYFKAPYVHLLEPAELERLRKISYEEETPKVLDYWRKRFAQGMRILTPDPAVNTFYNAALWHVIITTDRDPVTGLYNQGVGTVRYGVYANETVMIARAMDMRGEHTEAERFLEPMLHFQGDIGLKGRYSTKEGVFHSAGPYTHGEYAMNHGFVLWGIADHYRQTRNRPYLDRVAPQLIKGCEFLIRERQATMTPPGRSRWPIHGLSPASSLEDVVEYQYWLSTNSFFYLGMKRVADVLQEIGHPEAARLADEAEKYRRDIEIAAREATTQASVVRLRDGTWVPYTPSRIYQWRPLTEGWIREALYPALNLAVGEVVPCEDPLITWQLDALEDVIFFSRESGYGIADVDRNWFHQGAVTLQPCLLDTPIIYMIRDEIPAGLRAFWNSYALLIYPDVNCFAEWARHLGQGGGPIYKTADEARWVMWLRQFLVYEHGDELWYARAMPAEWLHHGKTTRVEDAATFFGRTSLTIDSQVDRDLIEVVLTLPDRSLPAKAVLRLRHPVGRSPQRVTINDRPLAAEAVIGQDILLPLEGRRPGDRLNIIADYALREGKAF